MPILKSHYPCFVIGLFLVLLNGTQNRLRAQNDDIYFESLAPELGLSQITVSGIYQDSKGFTNFSVFTGVRIIRESAIILCEEVTGARTRLIRLLNYYFFETGVIFFQ